MFYLFGLFKFATRSWLARSKRGVGQLIGYLMQTAIIAITLINVPAFRSINTTEEMLIASATFIGLIGSGFLMFFWDLLTAPGKMHQELLEENGELSKALEGFLEVELCARMLSRLYYEGYDLYSQDNVSRAEWEHSMEQWFQRVMLHLSENFSASYEHRFRRIGGGFVRQKSAEWARDEDGENEIYWLLSKWTMRLDVLNDIVTDSYTGFIKPLMETSELRSKLNSTGHQSRLLEKDATIS